MSLSGRPVLVTGADGFIGSHLVERLVGDGARVRAVCLYNSFGSAGWLDRCPDLSTSDVEIRFGDIRDSGFVDEVVEGVEMVAHLAALISIPYSYDAPRSYVDTNVVGTLNVLDSVRRHGIARLVHTSTSEVYGTPATVPIREDHPLQGQSPYAATKIAADKLCEAWACSFGTPVVVLRPFNTYGPRQSARAVITTMLVQLLGGTRHVSLGSLVPRRDFTFVSDTVDGFVRALEAELEPGEVVHLGTGRSISIGELFSLACEVVGSTADVVTDGHRLRPETSEVMVLESDPGRAERRLGWRATVELREGLRRTAAWLADGDGRTITDAVSR